MTESQTVTSLVTDLVASTERRVRLGEERTNRSRRLHDEPLRSSVVEIGGGLIKSVGDAEPLALARSLTERHIVAGVGALLVT